ncbi:MAG: DUF2442 domain-containing protein [Ignavibacteria bacterium]|nr:DUF2442 domain-containing protein [Ignavibacteria bacterium]
MYYDLEEVKYKHGYILEVAFVDGTKGEVNLEEYAKKGGVFSSFTNIEFFKKVFIHPELKVLTWPDEIDIAPETIYLKVTGSLLNKVV